MEKVLKFIKECPIVLGVVIGAVVLTIVSFVWKESAYSSYAEETDTKETPVLAVALKGAQDGVFPWSEVTGDSEMEWNAASGDDVIAEVSEVSDAEGDRNKGAAADNKDLAADGQVQQAEGSPEVAKGLDAGDQTSDGQVQADGGQATEETTAAGQEQTSADGQEVAEGSSQEQASGAQSAEGTTAEGQEQAAGGQTGQEQAADVPAVAGASGQGQPEVTDALADSTAKPVVIPVVEDRVYNFTSVSDDYFSDALFIGDSRTVGLSEYCAPLDERAVFYAKISMSIYDVMKKKFISSPNGKIGLEQALSENNFGKIYIMLGLNEIGTGNDEYFRDAYKGVIDRIRELQPGAIIYIQGIMHVTAAKSAGEKYFNNERVNSRNAAISTLADQKYVFYIDMNPAVDDENGNLQADISFDGVHLKASAYQKWYDFLLQHAIVR